MKGGCRCYGELGHLDGNGGGTAVKDQDMQSDVLRVVVDEVVVEGTDEILENWFLHEGCVGDLEQQSFKSRMFHPNVIEPLTLKMINGDMYSTTALTVATTTTLPFYRRDSH